MAGLEPAGTDCRRHFRAFIQGPGIYFLQHLKSFYGIAGNGTHKEASSTSSLYSENKLNMIFYYSRNKG